MLGRVLLGSLLAMSASRCDRGGDGEDAPMPPGCDVDEDPGCEAGDAGVDMGEGGMAVDMGDGDSAGTTAATSGGEEPLFSVLPPYDVLGAEWTYRIEPTDGSAPYEQRCEISSVTEQPGQGVLARLTCDFGYTEYLVTGDEIFLVGSAGGTVTPPALIFRIPLDIGDHWTNEYVSGPTQATEEWVVVGEDLTSFAGFGAQRTGILDLVTSVGDSQAMSRIWIADGVGAVRSERPISTESLVSFSTP